MDVKSGRHENQWLKYKFIGVWTVI